MRSLTFLSFADRMCCQTFGFCATLKYYFFSLETSGFVDKLFESLYTKNYLPPLEPVKPEPKPPVQEKEEIKEEVMQSFLLLGGFLAPVTSILTWKLTCLEVISFHLSLFLFFFFDCPVQHGLPGPGSDPS